MKKNPAQTSKVVTNKIPVKQVKKKSKVGLFIFIIVILYILLQFSKFFSPIPMLGMHLVRLLDNVKHSGGSLLSTTLLNTSKDSARNSQSEVNVSGLTSDVSVKVSKVNESEWPSGNVGGVYDVSPSGNFDDLVKVTVTLNETPGPGFTLGYWYPETSTWERIPTVRRTATVYEGYISHATYVIGSTLSAGGTSIESAEEDGVLGSENFKFRDPNMQIIWKRINDNLQTIADRYSEGIGGYSDDPLWTSVEISTGTLADMVIPLCNDKPSMQDRLEFLQVMSVAQVYGFENTSRKFYDAWDECIPSDITTENSAYYVKQTDRLPFDWGVSGIATAKGETVIASEGTMTRISRNQKYGWQGEWQVIQNVTSEFDFTSEMEIGYLRTNTIFDSGNTRDLIMLIFSLENVREGEEFPIWMVRVGTYEQESFGPPQDLVVYYNNEIFGTTRIEPGEKIIKDKGSIEIKAVLEKVDGNNGAVVQYDGGMGSIIGTQGDALRQVREMVEEYDYLKEWYSDLYDLEATPVRLRIEKAR